MKHLKNLLILTLLLPTLFSCSKIEKIGTEADLEKIYLKKYRALEVVHFERKGYMSIVIYHANKDKIALFLRNEQDIKNITPIVKSEVEKGLKTTMLYDDYLFAYVDLPFSSIHCHKSTDDEYISQRVQNTTLRVYFSKYSYTLGSLILWDKDGEDITNITLIITNQSDKEKFFMALPQEEFVPIRFIS